MNGDVYKYWFVSNTPNNVREFSNILNLTVYYSN